MWNNNDGMPLDPPGTGGSMTPPPHPSDTPLPPPSNLSPPIFEQLVCGIKSLASLLGCRSEYVQKLENPGMSLQCLEKMFLKLQSRVYRDSVKKSEQGPMELTEVNVMNLDLQFEEEDNGLGFPTDLNLCLKRFRKIVHQESNGKEVIQLHERMISEKNLALWYNGGDIRQSNLSGSNISNWIQRRVLDALHGMILAQAQPGFLVCVDAVVHVKHKKVYMMPHQLRERAKLSEECMICHELLWRLETRRAYNCSHMIHSGCIETYRSNRQGIPDHCPMCRSAPRNRVPHGGA